MTGAATTEAKPDQSATGAPPAGLVLGDRYVLAAPLGRGGMASVYRAHDRRLARPVAIKVLHQTDRAAAETALREDRVTARLAHPHIVGIYDSGTTPDGRPYLVMELIEGPPLSRLAPLPVARALAIGEEIAAALAHAHGRGIVHCDLKPQNVLLDAANGAKLTDFGVAARDAAPVGAVVYGSAAYLAPERLRGAPTSPAVDIYALGALLYFLIAGQAPYPGDGGAALAARVLAGPPAPLGAVAPGVPAAVEAVVRRAMAPDPTDRYQTAEDLRRALAAARAALRPGRARRDHPALVALAGALRLRMASAFRTGTQSVARGLPGATAVLARRRAALGGVAALALVALLLATAVPRLGARPATPTAAGVASGPAATPAPARNDAAPGGKPAVPTVTTAAAGPIRVEATLSDPAPRRTARLTVTGRLLRGDTGIAGVPMRTVWRFRSGDATCNSRAGTDEEGRASCTFSMSGATPGHEVVVDVSFEYEGRTYQTQLRFTPQ